MARKPEIEGRWAVVTGASSGIGLEFSRALATKGCNIVAISNQPKELAETAQMLQSEFEVETVTLDLDLTRPDATERVMELLDSHAIVPLLLINNAGIAQVVVRDDHDHYRIIDPMEWVDNDESLEGTKGY